jgi:hypothetical protein
MRTIVAYGFAPATIAFTVLRRGAETHTQTTKLMPRSEFKLQLLDLR